MKQNILLYNNYREYLKDYLEHKKSQVPGYSLRNFCRRVGFASNCYITMILNGQRNLSQKSLDRILPELKLSKFEESYFVNLVGCSQAVHLKDRLPFLEKLHSSAKQLALRNKIYANLELAQAEALEDYVAIVILEMAGSKGLKENPLKIAEEFVEKIHPTRVQKAIAKLIAAKLLRRKGRCLVAFEPMRATSPEIHSTAIAKLHLDLLELSKLSIHHTHPTQRDIEALMIKLDAAQFSQVKAKIYEFLKEISQNELTESEHDASNDESGKKIYAVNVQLIPLSGNLNG